MCFRALKRSFKGTRGNPEIRSAALVIPYSCDDAEALSEERMGTEAMVARVPSAWLLIEEGKGREKRYQIRETVISIDTGDDNDIGLKHRAVSRHHTKVRIEGKKYFIYDLTSTNATRINGGKMTKKRIKEGRRIEMGHTRMALRTNDIPQYKHKPNNLLKM